MVCVEPLSKLSNLRSHPDSAARTAWTTRGFVQIQRCGIDPMWFALFQVHCAVTAMDRCTSGALPRWFWPSKICCIPRNSNLWRRENIVSLASPNLHLHLGRIERMHCGMTKTTACFNGVSWCGTIQLDNSDIRWWLFQAMFDCIWIGLWAALAE